MEDGNQRRSLALGRIRTQKSPHQAGFYYLEKMEPGYSALFFFSAFTSAQIVR